MSDRLIVHDRVGVHGQEVPVDPSTCIDIPQEFYDSLERMRKLSEELNNVRLETGRLFQVLMHLGYIQNNTEKNLAEEKRSLINTLNLEDGNWVIDFSTKQLFKTIPVINKTPNVV